MRAEIFEYITNLPLAHIIAISILLGALLIQLIYYLLVYIKPIRWKQKEIHKEIEPLSVIICAKNELPNLEKNLPKVLEQDYPNYEVIVVNDCSTDNTEMFLGELELKYKNLRHTTIEPDKKFFHGKKLAVTIGMKSAKNNRLIFTDADCYPDSDQWLREYNKSYVINKQIVIGFGGYEKRKGLLNKIIQYDTLMVAANYLGFALSGRPYMGVGRNMSYLKQIFFSGKGFASHYHVLSGDDDLFINENADKNNTAVLLSKESITTSMPETTWRAWAKQKKRHLTTGKFYKFWDKFFLGLETFSRLVFYLSIILLLILKADYFIIAGIFAIRMIVQMLILKLNMNKLNQKGFLLLIPLLDIMLPLIHLFFIISNKLNARKTKW